MKRVTVICDKCGEAFVNHDERVADEIADSFPSADLCPECYLLIEMAGEVAKQAVLRGCTPQQIIERMLENYQ